MGCLGPEWWPVLLPGQRNAATNWMGAKDQPHRQAKEIEMAYQDYGTCWQLN